SSDLRNQVCRGRGACLRRFLHNADQAEALKAVVGGMDKDVLHEGVLFALQEPKYVANPYPLYQRLRSEAPVYWDFVSSAWFVTRYADVRTGLVDPRLS